MPCSPTHPVSRHSMIYSSTTFATRAASRSRAVERLELALDDFRRRFPGRVFTATAASTVTIFGCRLRVRTPSRTSMPTRRLTVRPVTFADAQAATPLKPGSAMSAEFAVTLEGLSAFFVVSGYRPVACR